MVETLENVEATYDRMQFIDQQQLFEKDDDVGIVFLMLKIRLQKEN